MKLSIISFTQKGSHLGKKLHMELQQQGHQVQAFAMEPYAGQLELEPLTSSLKEWTGQQFTQSAGIIFIGAAGIAVRVIAPYIKDKTKDPAVLVIDEKGQFVIPILSGHIGGANELAMVIANRISATSVITTATDINHKFAVDVFAKKNNLYIDNMTYAKEISATVLNNQTVGFVCDFPISGVVPESMNQNNKEELGICISLEEDKKPFTKTLNLIPAMITLGIGCRRGKSMEEIERVVLELFAELHLSIYTIQKVATIDLKKDETGILEFCKKYNLAMEIYSAEQLETAQGEFTESDYVKSVTGVGNVCERAALLGSSNGTLIQKKSAGEGITLALAKKEWSVNFE